MTDNTEPTIDELIDKYRADIMLSAQGLNSDNEQYKNSAINVAALASLNLKKDLQALISDQVAKAGYDELQRLDRSIEEHPNWGFRDWHETNFIEKILADRMIELQKEQGYGTLAEYGTPGEFKIVDPRDFTRSKQ